MVTIEDASAQAIDLALDILDTHKPTTRRYKTDRDYATDIDDLIERQVRELLADLTPDCGFLGEEEGALGDAKGRVWCLDPIDGTTNYARGIPNYGVSLALIEGDQPVHGEIALPRHGERYVTRDGRAFCNGDPISVSGTTEIREAIVSVGDFATGAGSAEKNLARLATLARLADRVARVRMLGSAATDLAWLAAGRIDAVVMHSNHPWDVAAGVALARTAGATTSDGAAAPYTTRSGSLYAATPSLSSQAPLTPWAGPGR